MTLLFLLALALTVRVIIPIFQQPIPSGITLLLLALLRTVFLGFTVRSWYGYLLFLIYVRGILVAFGYVCAITPNTLFLAIPKIPLILTLVVFTTIFSIRRTRLLQPATISWQLGAYSMLSEENLSIYWAVALILLRILIIAVYIIFKKVSPLRGFDVF